MGVNAEGWRASLLVLSLQDQVQLIWRKIVEKAGVLQEKGSDDHLQGEDERNLVLLVEDASTDVVAEVFCRFPYSML